MLEAFQSAGSFRKGNLHCHSMNSDGDLSPERVCSYYAEAGYDFVCLSDHFLPRYGFPISDTTPYRREGFTTLLGAELHAGAMSAGEIWHILGVGLPADFAPTPEGESGPELAQRALDAGAFVAIPHPEWYGLNLDDALSMPEGVHAVEMHNHTSHVAVGRGGGSFLLDQMLVAGRMAGAIAVDDAHRYNGDALGGWVMVKAAENTPEALLDALKRNACYASTGADIVHAEIANDHLYVETSPASLITLTGNGSRGEKAYGQGMRFAKLPLERFAGSWARLTVHAADGTKAWGQPFTV